MSPLRFLGEASSGWWDEDTLLASALTRYETECIAPSGYPWRIAGDKEHAGDWEIDEERVDYAMAALDEYTRERCKKDSEPEPGVRPYVRFTPTLRPNQR